MDSEDPDGSSPWDRSHLHARWQRRASRGPAYDLQYTRSNADYEPGTGFLPRRDFTQANVLANWYFFKDDHPWLRRIWPGMLAFSTFRNSDGSVESGQYAVWVQWETKSGWGGWLEPKMFVEDVGTPFSIGGTTFPRERISGWCTTKVSRRSGRSTRWVRGSRCRCRGR